MCMNIANTCAHSGVTRTSALHRVSRVSPEAGVSLDAYKKISQQTGSKGTSRVALLFVFHNCMNWQVTSHLFNTETTHIHTAVCLKPAAWRLHLSSLCKTIHCTFLHSHKENRKYSGLTARCTQMYQKELPYRWTSSTKGFLRLSAQKKLWDSSRGTKRMCNCTSTAYFHQERRYLMGTTMKRGYTFTPKYVCLGISRQTRRKQAKKTAFK